MDKTEMPPLELSFHYYKFWSVQWTEKAPNKFYNARTAHPNAWIACAMAQPSASHRTWVS